MTLLLSARELADRRIVAGGSLRPLAESLASDFAVVLARPLYVPEQKALLSRDGGRCPRDGTMLEFDPFSPHAHRCPLCGAVYGGELHDRFWIYWYQLWLAERAVHGALLGAMGIEPRGTAFAESVLAAYVDQYQRYPNVDNALGPTRPFFSTYLESIWLVQLCVALDLTEMANGRSERSAPGARFRDRVIEPSLDLIQSYDEGMSNRQVWNNAALMAGNALLQRPDDVDRAIWSESGLAMHLTEALLPDGTWYEGENYHLFAHRGLWYGMEIARQFDADIPPALVDRYRSAFATPLLTALPDFTLPSRRDSQYAISLRQWRFAEMCELGLAEAEDPMLLGALGKLYADDVPRRDTGRSRSSAEAERNFPASALSRADLGWRSLLFARPELPGAVPPSLPSVLLDAQGIGVMRRDGGRTFVALDYGHSGGGHGHPDRLNLLLMRDDVRWLDDYGTGSYVDPSLHWYRSTLAHNAPMVDGRSQQRTSGYLEAYEDRGGAGWISATAPIAPGAMATRTIVAMPDYMVDEITWNAAGATLFDLPLHVDALPVAAAHPITAAELEGSQAEPDGFRFLSDTVRVASIPDGQAIQLRATRGGQMLDFWLGGNIPFELWRAKAPGAPGEPEASFLVVRSYARRGTIRGVWSVEGSVASAQLFPAIVAQVADARHEHVRVAHGWDVVITVGGARSTINLQGIVNRRRPAPDDESIVEDDERRAAILRPGSPIQLTLAQESYRRSEESWRQAGQPTADLVLRNDRRRLAIEVVARNVERTFVPEGAVNRLDNESADVNGAGIQLYLRTDEGSAAYLLVPDLAGTAVRVRQVDGQGGAIPVEASWKTARDGYVVTILAGAGNWADGTVVDLDVIINEKPASRERRRGQLVLSGGDGDYIYLRGDRHDPSRLIPLLLTDD